VRYGLEPKWIIKDVRGSIQCNSGAFGRDPYPGKVKSCECLNTQVKAEPIYEAKECTKQVKNMGRFNDPEQC